MSPDPSSGHQRRRPRRRVPRVVRVVGGPAARLQAAWHGSTRAGDWGWSPRVLEGRPGCSPTRRSSAAGFTRSRTCSTRCRSPHPGAKKALAEIWQAEDKDHARAAASAFAGECDVKWPKAAAKITDDLDVLLAFYDYQAEHWIHLRTINPIESTFATVRLRQRATKGPGSHAAGVAMAFKLIEAARARWRMVNAPHLVALVRAGARFEKGKLVERPDEPTGADAPDVREEAA